MNFNELPPHRLIGHGYDYRTILESLIRVDPRGRHRYRGFVIPDDSPTSTRLLYLDHQADEFLDGVDFPNELTNDGLANELVKALKDNLRHGEIAVNGKDHIKGWAFHGAQLHGQPVVIAIAEWIVVG